MEFAYSITATDLAEPRLEAPEDLYDVLVAQSDTLGPAVAGNLCTGPWTSP